MSKDDMKYLRSRLDRATVREMSTMKWQKERMEEFLIERYETGEMTFSEAATGLVGMYDGEMDKDLQEMADGMKDLWPEYFEDHNNVQCTHCGWTEVRPSGRCGECGAKDGEL